MQSRPFRKIACAATRRKLKVNSKQNDFIKALQILKLIQLARGRAGHTHPHLTQRHDNTPAVGDCAACLSSLSLRSALKSCSCLPIPILAILAVTGALLFILFVVVVSIFYFISSLKCQSVERTI